MQKQPENALKKVLIILAGVCHFFRWGIPFGRRNSSNICLPLDGCLPFSPWMMKKEYETLRQVGSEALLSEIPEGVVFIAPIPASLRWNIWRRKDGLEGRTASGTYRKNYWSARRWMFRSLLPDRQLTWLPYAVRAGRRIIKQENIDLIFATCPPFSDALIGACLRVLTGKRLVLDFRDDWIEHLGTTQNHS